ncbi:MAG: transcriptional regulator [Rhodobacteraceae bacterium]|nr:MAG: transcriptional regulator [Paracoccaceae bacterium]
MVFSMTKPPRLSKQDWLKAGFRALTKHGPSGLKAEPLARSLGTTKGSFYWHFKDIGQFREAMMAHWEQRAYTDVVSHLEAEPSVPKRLRLLGQIAANAAWPDYGDGPIEPAIRAWSRSEAMAAQAVLRVDARRLHYLGGLLAEIGLTNPDFARIIYAGLIGLEDLSSRDDKPVETPLGTLIDIVLTLE